MNDSGPGTMKLIHISDIHINDTAILGHDPVDNFKQCMSHINSHHPDADMVVITGDLTHHGHSTSYTLLKELLLKWQGDPVLMIGNHDNRDRFLEFFPHQTIDDHGFVQQVTERPEGWFQFLDTVRTGVHSGEYCDKRREWLETQLKQAETLNVPVYLFMHHNPVDVGIRNADRIGLLDGDDFRQILMRYNKVIRHIFFGHCHYVLSGSVCGIPMSAPRSTNHPCLPDFSGSEALGMVPSPATYNVCLIDDHSVVVHSIDFQLEDQAIWYETSAMAG
ncbi:MAG: metallophosphoesterase [Rhizobiaceae bacterium]